FAHDGAAHRGARPDPRPRHRQGPCDRRRRQEDARGAPGDPARLLRLQLRHLRRVLAQAADLRLHRGDRLQRVHGHQGGHPPAHRRHRPRPRRRVGGAHLDGARPRRPRVRAEALARPARRVRAGPDPRPAGRLSERAPKCRKLLRPDAMKKERDMSAQGTAGAPLAGLKVVELHAIGPVPFAGMMLLNLGAEVIRVSPPADPSLGIGIDNEYDVFNNRKTARHIDLKSESGRAELLELLATADVMTEGFRPGVLERLGLAPAELAKTHPRLVIGRLSGWGGEGPYAARAGHDINYLALSGILNAIGKDEPVVPLNGVADSGGGPLTLPVGALAKLVQRSINGRGGGASTSILAGTIGLSPMFHGMIAAGRWNLQRCNNLLDGRLPFY